MKLIIFTLLTIISIGSTSVAQNTWSQKANYGGGTVNAASAFSIGDKGYMGGGFDSDTYEALSSFWEYNPNTDTWSQKADIGGSPRGYTVGFSIGNKGYIGGGIEDTLAFKDFWEYNPVNNSWTQKADMGGPSRISAASFSINDKGYIGCGYNIDSGSDLKDFWEYNPANNNWVQKADFGGLERQSPAFFSTGGKGYIGTGYDYENDIDLKDLWEYNPTNNSWLRKTDLPGSEREFATGFSIGENGYITCGYQYETNVLLKDLWEFSPISNSWSQKADFGGLPRQVATGFKIGSKGYISCGYNFDTGLNDLWQYTPTSSSNQVPTANAGTDITITLPTNSTILNGSGTDSDGTIISYSWAQVGNTPSTALISNTNISNPTVSSLIEGTYIFKLTVTDNEGDSHSDDVLVIVNPAPNQAPLVDAGSDIILTLPINSTLLNGSAFDNDGSISTYNWTQMGNTPSNATISDPGIANPTVSDLIQGTYTFVLTVFDNDGASASDEVLVIVNPAVNQLPVADAGTDITITLPVNSTSLSGNGTDGDGTIATYAWVQVGNTPSTATISNPGIANPTVSDLVQGTYTFRLTVTDDDGASDFDEVNVIVNSSANQSPLAYAGNDITITLPVNSTALNGDGSDPDGTIASFAWEQVGSTPSVATLTGSTSTTPTVSNLIEGTYTFRLTVTDDDGATATDEVMVIVNSALNQPPEADAGTDISITLPTNNTSLNGSGTDPDGTITGYAWEQVGSTPSDATMIGISTPTPTVAGLIEGTYTFRLTVTDNSGGTATDEVRVFVGTSQNQPPSANAGVDITLTLPTNFTLLNGSGTDPDGTINSYAWDQVGNTPNIATLIGISTPTPTVASLVVGTYTFRLTVTDNSGATATDDVQVIVKASLANSTIDFIPPSVYPNPSPNGKVYISPGNRVKIGSKVSWANIEGRILGSFEIRTSKQELDLSDYPSGFYFLRFENGVKVKLILME